jgi:DNA polymerase-3 subunit gamma/tau
MANDCDQKYKTSKNQRLLVELTIMKLSSIDFDGEKKNCNSLNYIIPASYFKDRIALKKNTNSDVLLTSKELPEIIDEKIDSIAIETTTISNTSDDVSKVLDNSTIEPEISITNKNTQDKNEPEIKVSIKSPQNRVSGLSLSSLKLKKEHLLNKKDDSIDESKLPKTSFTEEEMQKHWAVFVHQIDGEGRKILASNLNTDLPKLRDAHTIWIELPNSTMKKEIEREQFDLMEYLRLKLNNHFIKLKITINEATAKKFAFTPEEKYEKLREKNPAIDILRREFDLDL